MKQSRRISLKSESLTVLTGDDLANVAGGNKPLTDGCPTNDRGFCSFLCRSTYSDC